jgi:tRNA(Ile)-lysidine synthase TilS/MesJ
LQVFAIHIDYNNRPESATEAAFVQDWCSRQGVDCRTRVVTECRRADTGRDAYERQAREIRFAFYRQVFAEAHVNSSVSKVGAEADAEAEEDAAHAGVSGGKRWWLSPDGCPPTGAVMFGHHEGDVQENVISNAMRGCSPLELSGMREISVCDGVEIWRPFIAHDKSAIYAFAHKYGVPYFKDSTPSWSTRGKLRSRLVPLLQEMYGDGVLANLSSLAR